MKRNSRLLKIGFYLTVEERGFVLVVCALLLLGLVARCFYLKNEKPRGYTPVGIDAVEVELHASIDSEEVR